jgi:hypothetical protein
MRARVERLVEDDNEVREALVTTKYQERVVGADRAAVARLERLRRQVEALAAKLATQAARQERLWAAWSRSAARSSPAWPPSAATTSA